MTKPLIKTQPIAEPWDLYPTAYQSIKQQQKKLRGQGRGGGNGKKTPAVPVFKTRPFVFQSLQVIAQLFASTIEQYFQP